MPHSRTASSSLSSMLLFIAMAAILLLLPVVVVVVVAVDVTAIADITPAAVLSTSYGFITLLIKCHKIKSNFAVGKAFAFPFSPSNSMACGYRKCFPSMLH